MADQFRTVFGIVAFDPREGEAGGKKVRNISVRQNGFGPTAVLVQATLWPSHAHVDVKKGDVVILEGKYQQRDGERDGEPVKYHNISVARIKNLGASDAGEKVEVENAAPANDDEIPF